MRIPGTLRVVATTCIAGLLLITATAAQDDPPVRTSPLLLSDVALPAIDRGVREFDPPKPPRSARTARHGGSTPTPYLRGSIIVKFRPGTTATARQAMLARVGGSTTRALPYAPFDIVAIDPSEDAEAAARRLAEQPDVEYAQARYRVYPSFVPNDPLYTRQWNFPAIDMERAWDINPGATSSIVVAVLDSGVAYRSAMMQYTAGPINLGPGGFFPPLGTVTIPFAAAPDLGGADRFVAPRDFIWDTSTPLDLDGHGTHVSGTLGQLTNNGVGVAGMAFNVRIMPVKVVDGIWDAVFGSPFEGTDDVVARGVRYAVDNGARVLNMSIGRNGSAAPVVKDAVTYAVTKGAFVVLAGGNGFTDGNLVERFAEFAPSIDGAVSVGATGQRGTRAFYSTTGPYIELVAPGGDQRADGTTGGILQQTYDFDLTETYLYGPSGYRPPRFDSFAYDYLQGTSMATPHVAGFAAMLMQQGITNPAAIEAIMKRFATDLGQPGRDDAYGYGLINPRATLRGLGLVR